MKYFKVPNEVFNLNLTPIEFYVLCCLLKCRNSVTGKCFPSYSKIASDCHISRSSVAKAVKSLQEKQILKVQHNYYNHNTEFLYPEAGTLTIDLKETGYSFGVDIKSSRSQGVNYMKVFCYDMVLAELGCARNQFPDFLVHDSTIFDGVDERQVARALILAHLKCEKLGYQYICLVNSDMIPYEEFDDEFTSQFNSNIVLRISDDQENGGLLGIRF